MGAGTVVDRRYVPGRDYDPRLVDPTISLRDIIDFSSEDTRQAFMSHTLSRQERTCLQDYTR